MACHQWDQPVTSGALSVMTAQPTSTGMQPAAPPHTTFWSVRRFSHMV